jgi:NAD-dependent SIR2 family protein deacetylase
MSETRAFFLGAGASCADGFPLTSDIVYGLAHTMLRDRDKYKRPLSFLRTVFRVTRQDLEHGANRWEALKRQERPQDLTPVLLPDIVELLSLLDVLIADESLVGGRTRRGKGNVRPFSPRELSRVREHIGRAVYAAFSSLVSDGQGKPYGETSKAFVNALNRDDTVVTTNWDLLLDIALHSRYRATDPTSVGSDVTVLDLPGNPIPQGNPRARPPLYKLHGSLNWLSCSRCTRLYVNPTLPIAPLAFEPGGSGDHNTCDCGMRLSTVLITPTYFKQYRNRHLLNIWSHAQGRLAQADTWHFIGYSLPTDDVHIRALLLRAMHMRIDKRAGPPEVVVVTHRPDAAMEARYRRLFREVTVDTTGFTRFVQDTLTPAAS